VLLQPRAMGVNKPVAFFWMDTGRPTCSYMEHSVTGPIVQSRVILQLL
jgi:hypothetical protein